VGFSKSDVVANDHRLAVNQEAGGSELPGGVDDAGFTFAGRGQGGLTAG
jgi:hypothetical protein